MKKCVPFLVLLALVACKTIPKNNVATEKILWAQNDRVTVYYNGQAFPMDIAATNINFPFSEEAADVAFATTTDTVRFRLWAGDKIPVKFLSDKKDTVRMVAVGLSKPARFSKDFIAQNRGTYKVFCPEVHELVNIAVALTKAGREDDNMVKKGHAYYKRVMQHFDPFRNHALIDTLNRYISEMPGEDPYGFYYNIRMGACMYTFDKDKIVNVSPYNQMAFGARNELEGLIPLFEDFAKTSGFKSFYKTNGACYENLVTSYQKWVPVHKMWKWVEARFPQRYDAYKVYFSPLVGGAHSTQKFTDNGYSETVMFIDAPTLEDATLTEKEKEAAFSRVVFTEIDHNYVNPTTEKFPEISTLLQPLDCWNNGAQGYPDPVSTFNEYMTWAVFTLYLYDNFDENVFKKHNETEARFMAEGRGFVKFREFNGFVLEWYKNNPGKPLETLYPEVIGWLKTQKCT